MQRGLGYGHKDARHSKFNPSTYLRIESAQMHKPRTVVSLSVFKGMRVRVVPYKPAQHTIEGHLMQAPRRRVRVWVINWLLGNRIPGGKRKLWSMKAYTVSRRLNDSDAIVPATHRG